MSRHKLHIAGNAAPDAEIGRRLLDQIRALHDMSISELKAKWIDLVGAEPPRHAKRSFLTQLIAWEIQAKAMGGIKPSLHRRLLQIGSPETKGATSISQPPAPTLRPGVKLIRVWQGVTHHVIVTDSGFSWQNRTWRSLSVIAREITGTPWSGPVFFGLKKSVAKSQGTTTSITAPAQPLNDASVVDEEMASA